MIESVATLGAPQLPATRREPDEGGFSFAMAMSALHDRAATALDVFGAAPAQPAVEAVGETGPSAAGESAENAPAGDAEAARAGKERSAADSAGAPANRSASGATTAPVATPAAPSSVLALQAAAPHGGAGPAGAGSVAATTSAKGEAALRAVEAGRTEPAKATRAETAPAKTTATAKDFAQVLARRLEAGKTQFELRLDPPDLGKVEARLTISGDGDKTLALTFETASTRDLFAQDESALRQSLDFAAFSMDRDRIVFELADAAPAAATPASPAAEPALLVPWTSGAVDIRI